MKYLFQFGVIMLFVFIGEVMEYFIPLPIAGSIYGLILLFIALVTGIVKLSWVADVADWLHGIMSLFFVAPAVAIIGIWGDIADIWPMLVILLVVAYLVTMVTTGVTAQALIPDAAERNVKQRGRAKVAK
ncbi:MAG: CidA/LrgA family protein [Alphaproteobacteria bacterium]|nr:CidA/LrgA family protein [Alphaproteobacteria bacterium]MDE6571067.1 CidA/LrgA family protein [Alphaproteobacteria bacterium]